MIAPIPSDRLVRHCDPAAFPFATTADLRRWTRWSGRTAPWRPWPSASRSASPGTTCYAMGPEGIGKLSLLRQVLRGPRRRRARRRRTRCYVHNFADPRRPRALCLPTGERPPLPGPDRAARAGAADGDPGRPSSADESDTRHAGPRGLGSRNDAHGCPDGLRARRRRQGHGPARARPSAWGSRRCTMARSWTGTRSAALPEEGSRAARRGQRRAGSEAGRPRPAPVPGLGTRDAVRVCVSWIARW